MTRREQEDEDEAAARPLKRLTSPEKFEAQQLIASGVLDVRDYPQFDLNPNPIPIPNPNPHASRRPGAACRVLTGCIAARCRRHCLYCDGLY